MIILCGLSILKFKSSKVNKYIYIYNLASKSSIAVKEGTFNSIWCVKKRENSDRKNSLFLQFMQCSLYNDFFFTLVIYSTSIHFRPVLQLWKNCSSWVEHWVEMDQTHSKGKSSQQNMAVFFVKIDRSNWCGRKSWVVVIKLSKKFSPFFQVWHQLYLYFG